MGWRTASSKIRIWVWVVKKMIFTVLIIYWRIEEERVERGARAGQNVYVKDENAARVIHI